MKRTTTQKHLTPKLKEIKEQLTEKEDYLRPLVGLLGTDTKRRGQVKKIILKKSFWGRVGWQMTVPLRSKEKSPKIDPNTVRLFD